jgi:hypothetical protein
MASDLDPSVVSSVVNANFKTIAETPALLANQFMSLNLRAAENALDAQQNQRLLSNAIMGSLTKRIVETDIEEAVANRNNATADLPQRIVDSSSADSAAAITQSMAAAFAQILAKLAQSTPPETGKSSVG